jgi:hypothetical protein
MTKPTGCGRVRGRYEIAAHDEVKSDTYFAVEDTRLRERYRHACAEHLLDLVRVYRPDVHLPLHLITVEGIAAE